MKNLKLSKETKNLLLFIVIVLVGLGLILTGFLLNNNLKNTFVPTEEVKKYQPGFYIYLLEIGGAIIFLSSFGFLYTYLQAKFNLKKMTVKQMAVIGIFSALSIILYYFAIQRIDTALAEVVPLSSQRPDICPGPAIIFTTSSVHS